MKRVCLSLLEKRKNVCERVCVCVCVFERERKRERETESVKRIES